MKRALALAAVLAPAAVGAHGFAPGHLDLRERADGRVEALWKVPLGGEGGAGGREALRVRLTPACREVGRRDPVDVPGAVLERFALDCGPSGLGGRAVTLDGADERGVDALVTARFASGRRFAAVLRSDSPSVELPSAGVGSRGRVARGYLALGARHIATGADHLAFVLGLLLLARSAGSLVRTVTAFTAGHSVTLALAALGLARAPQAPVEAAIGASILLVGVELAAPEGSPPTLARRAPWAVAAGFGLLHGFGFAGALADAGLPEGNVPLALLFFNLGVELGQLAFVALAALALRAARGRSGGARAALTYAIGAGGAYWLLARTAVILGS